MMSRKGPRGCSALHRFKHRSMRALTPTHPNLAFADFSRWSRAQVHIFINQEFHLICQLFVWSDLRYPHVTTGTVGSGGFIRKRVGTWTAPWENKSQPLIPACNIILPQTPLFMDIGTSLFKRVIVFGRDCTFASFAASTEKQDNFYLFKISLTISWWEGTRPRAGKQPDTGDIANWWRFSSGPQRQQYIIKWLVICFVWQAGIYHFCFRGKSSQIKRERLEVPCRDRSTLIISKDALRLYVNIFVVLPLYKRNW